MYGTSDHYAVIWRDQERESAGKVSFSPDALVLSGADSDDTLIPYDTIRGLRIGHAEDERLRGFPTLLLEIEGRSPYQISTIGTPGALHELADLVHSLLAGSEERSSRFLVVVPLRPGKLSEVQQLVAEGPPFDLAGTKIRRHEVMLTDSEAVFIFEGDEVLHIVKGFLSQPSLWKAASRWRSFLAGPPRVAHTSYAWINRKPREQA